jgi:hypothetical protein
VRTTPPEFNADRIGLGPMLEKVRDPIRGPPAIATTRMVGEV